MSSALDLATIFFLLFQDIRFAHIITKSRSWLLITGGSGPIYICICNNISVSVSVEILWYISRLESQCPNDHHEASWGIDLQHLQVTIKDVSPVIVRLLNFPTSLRYLSWFEKDFSSFGTSLVFESIGVSMGLYSNVAVSSKISSGYFFREIENRHYYYQSFIEQHQLQVNFFRLSKRWHKM